MNTREKDIGAIANQEQRLLNSKTTLETLLGMEKIDKKEYQEQMKVIDKKLHQLQEKMEDSVADMLFDEEQAFVLKTHIGQSMSDKDLAEAIQIGEVVRGHIEDQRVIDVRFIYNSVKCKARITHERGVWSFSSEAKNLAKGLFIRALEQDEEAVDTFRREMKKHPEDWEDLVTKTHPGNFPRQAQGEFNKRLTVAKESDPLPSTEHESTHTVVIHSVKHGPLSKDLVHKKVGQDHCFISVRIDIDGDVLDLSIDTDTEKWKSSSAKFPTNVLSTVIPDMITALEKPENHIYLNRLISEIRKHRKQWMHTVTKNLQVFPKAVRRVLE